MLLLERLYSCPNYDLETMPIYKLIITIISNANYTSEISWFSVNTKPSKNYQLLVFCNIP